jgi:serine/threonine protein kinase
LILEAQDMAFPTPGRRVLIKTSRYPLKGQDDIFEGASRLGAAGYETIQQRRDYLRDEARYLLAFDSVPGIPVLRKLVEDWSPQLLGPHNVGHQNLWINDVALQFEGLTVEEAVNNDIYLVLQYVPGKPADQIAMPEVGKPERRRLVMSYLQTIAGLLSMFHRRQPFRGLFLDDARDLGFPEQGYHVFQDLKPANMIVSHGDQVFLIDFGGMETVAEDQNSGETYYLYGKSGIKTDGYSAPESSVQTSDLSDIYSLGCTACHLLLDRSQPVKRQSDVPMLISEIRTHYDSDLSSVIEACLQEDPDQRRVSIEVFNQRGRTVSEMLRRHLSIIE